MGYSARYHAASLAAVFVALAVGILIGVGFGSDVISGTAEDLEKSLESDLNEARAQIADLEDQLDAERSFEEAVYPAVVEEQLKGRKVAVIGLGGLSQEITDNVEAAIGPSGGEVGQVGVVTLPPDLDALADIAKGKKQARAASRGEPGAVSAVGAEAGRALVKGGPRFTDLRGTLLGRYSGSPKGIDAVVIAREQPNDLDPDDATDAFEKGLISGFRSVGEPAVGVELTSTDPSNVGFYDSEGIASVDSIDLLSGRVALVFTLAGAGGAFGVKDSADSLLPDLLAPPGGSRGGNSRESG